MNKNNVMSLAKEIWPCIDESKTKIITQTITQYSVPMTRWDRFKADHFPEWMLDRFPAHMKTHTKRPRYLVCPVMRHVEISSILDFDSRIGFDQITIPLSMQSNGLEAGYNEEFDILYVAVESQ